MSKGKYEGNYVIDQKVMMKEKSFRDKVNEAKTLAELWTAVTDKYGKENVATSFIRKNDIELVKRAVNTLDELEERYPFMKGYIRKLGSHYAGLAAWNSDKQQFCLNPNYWDADNEHLHSGNERGYHPPNTTPESIVAHEFGHAVQTYLLEKMTDWANHATKPSDMMKGVEIWSNVADGTVFEHIERRALDSLGLTHSSISEGRQKISQYARDAKKAGMNPSFEAFSEAFADVQSNGNNASPVSKAYVQALLEEIRIYGG